MFEDERDEISKTGIRPSLLLFLAPVVIGVLVRFIFPSSFDYTIWSDRDLLRAAEVWRGFISEGAEINGAYYARVPGGFYYYILGLFQLVTKQPIYIYLMLSAAVTAGFYIIYRTGRQILGLTGALAAIAAYSLSPGVISTANQIWNPALTLPLTSLIFLLLVRVIQGKSWALPWMMALIVITIQVHMSNLILLASILLLLGLVPHGTRLKHWLVSAIAFAILISPYLIGELENGWVNSNLILAGHGQSFYSAPSFDVLLETLTLLFGGGTPDSEILLQRFLTLLAAFLMIGVIWRTTIAGIRCRLGVSPLKWRQNLRNADTSEKIILSLAFVVAVCSVLMAINPNSAIYIRYVLFLIPPIALLVGAFINELMGRLDRIPVAAYGVAGVFSVFFTIHGYLYAERIHKSTNPLSGLAMLFDNLRSKAGYSDADLRRKILLIDANGDIAFHQAGYLISLGSNPSTGSSQSACTIAVDVPEINTAVSQISKVFSDRQIELPAVSHLFQAGNRQVFDYTLDAGNCYSSLFNAYDRSEIERRLHRACKTSTSDGLVLADESSKLMRKIFAIRHTFQPTRLCLGLDLALVNGKLITSLVTSHLKGYTGYSISSYRLVGARLRFEYDEHKIHELILIDDFVGGQGNIRTTPWRAENSPPPNGDYKLIFNAELAHQSDKTAKQETISVVLGEAVKFQTPY